MKTPPRALSALLLLSAAVAFSGCTQDAESALDTDGSAIEQTQAQVAAAQVAAAPEEPTPPVEVAPAPAPAPAASGPRPIRRADAPRTPAADPAPAAPRVPAFIAEGTSVAATVEEELSTQSTAEGDAFHARLIEDVLGANGEVLLPAGAVLNGRVSAAHASTGAQDMASLTLAVESITAGGRTLPLSADVIELDMEASTRDSNTETAAKTAAGAAAGALIGRILGRDRESTVKGAIAGAAAGGAVAAATRSGHATVKPGARMVVRLNERLIVEP